MRWWWSEGVMTLGEGVDRWNPHFRHSWGWMDGHNYFHHCQGCCCLGWHPNGTPFHMGWLIWKQHKAAALQGGCGTAHSYWYNLVRFLNGLSVTWATHWEVIQGYSGLRWKSPFPPLMLPQRGILGRAVYDSSPSMLDMGICFRCDSIAGWDLPASIIPNLKWPFCRHGGKEKAIVCFH